MASKPMKSSLSHHANESRIEFDFEKKREKPRDANRLNTHSPSRTGSPLTGRNRHHVLGINPRNSIA